MNQDASIITSTIHKQELDTKKLFSIKDWFIRSDFKITQLIILFNCILFLIMAITAHNISGFSTSYLLKWGANFAAVTLDGQSWRLISACFLHLNFFHLLFNMYVLYSLGRLLEPLLGQMLFFTAYCLTGVLSSFVSVGFNTRVFVSVGASGAIFGLLGIGISCLFAQGIPVEVKTQIKKQIKPLIIINLLYGLFSHHIDNYAHIGGLISGVIIGTFWLNQQYRKKNYLIALWIVILSSTWIGTKIVSSPLVVYNHNMIKIQKMSDQIKFILLSDKMVNGNPNIETLQAAILKGQEALQLTKETEKLIKLPSSLLMLNRARLNLFESQIKLWDYLQKKIDGKTDEYDKKIAECQSELKDAVINFNSMKNNPEFD